ncbi:hypothetical protein Rhal01_02275 [Rubritalea halochordaticola]|uniref:Uncharacterized protein n=1 Tax=Rubritalea halochordaticola TaxID=714537 RepID=A0ABP9V075_9BACT
MSLALGFPHLVKTENCHRALSNKSQQDTPLTPSPPLTTHLAEHETLTLEHAT